VVWERVECGREERKKERRGKREGKHGRALRQASTDTLLALQGSDNRLSLRKPFTDTACLVLDDSSTDDRLSPAQKVREGHDGKREPGGAQIVPTADTGEAAPTGKL
jgi:hypothetical protein